MCDFVEQVTADPDVLDPFRSVEALSDVHPNDRAKSFRKQKSQFLSARQADFEQQLEQVLRRSQVIERQLKTNDRQSFQQAELLIKVNALEQQLFMSNSAEEQLRVLNVRQEVINDILKLQKGTMYEYSI